MPEKKKNRESRVKPPDSSLQTPDSKLVTGNSKLPEQFYEKVLDDAEKIDFATVLGNDTVDDEIALLKVKIKAVVEKDPENIQLIMQATNMLAKLVKIKYSMNKKEEKSLGEAIKNIIRDIGVPLGVAALNKKL
jgi:hypothetical protein